MNNSLLGSISSPSEDAYKYFQPIYNYFNGFLCYMKHQAAMFYAKYVI